MKTTTSPTGVIFWVGLTIVAAAPAHAVDFVVNDTGRPSDCNLADGICLADDGTGTGSCGAVCTLAAATEQAAALATADTITFSLPVGSKVTTWTELSLGDDDTLEGRLAPGTLVDGVRLAVDGFGISLGSNGTLLHMEIINGGVTLFGDNNAVEGCKIHGVRGAAGANGISVYGDNNTIGGTTSFRGLDPGNIIYDNNQHGVWLLEATGTLIAGNVIGTQDGVVAFPNILSGILVEAASTTIDNNQLSGNASHGIELRSAVDTVITSNFIGATHDGYGAVLYDDGEGVTFSGNGEYGIWTTGTGTIIGGPSAPAIGGTCDGDCNLISGNGDGIQSGGGTIELIHGNFIGTDVTGTVAVGNQWNGINVNCVDTTIITSNLVSGNGISGMWLSGGCAVDGNVIGTTSDLRESLGNGTRGMYLGGAGEHMVSNNIVADNPINIQVQAEATIEFNFIGVTQPTANEEIYFGSEIGLQIQRLGSNSVVRGNLITGHSAGGISLTPGTSPSPLGPSGVLIESNIIGPTIVDEFSRGNDCFGIAIFNGADNVVGGDKTTGNFIHTSRSSVACDNDVTYLDPGSAVTIEDGENNRVYGNTIGLTESLSTTAGSKFGVSITTSIGNEIGGLAPDTGNIIVNNDVGILLNADSNAIYANEIGLAVFTGPTTHEDHWNSVGISLDYANQNIIGAPTAGNHIKFSWAGIDFTDSSSDNIVEGNTIGDPGGDFAMGNAGVGINFAIPPGLGSPSSNNSVIGNVIAGNDESGVAVEAGDGNLISQNSIFHNSDRGIRLGQAGIPLENDPLDADVGPNRLMNRPVLTNAVDNLEGGCGIDGSVETAGGAGLTVELFAGGSCDPSIRGQGEAYVGSVNVTADAGGHGVFQFYVVPCDATYFFTATLTDVLLKDTSEFSDCLQAEPADPDGDLDLDGVINSSDNCVLTANPDQADEDGDGYGDACDECPKDPDKSVGPDCAVGTVADKDGGGSDGGGGGCNAGTTGSWQALTALVGGLLVWTRRRRLKLSRGGGGGLDCAGP